MIKLFNRKKPRLLLTCALLLSILVLVFFPHTTFAGTDSVLDACGISSPVKCLELLVIFAVFGLIYFIGWIGFNLLGFSAAFADVIIARNFDVLSSSTVQTGFNIVLQVANLGFVIAIILIAFATIFRSQTYGMKQMLWKLIVAAVLVNFSLLLAGVIIDFAHLLAITFLDALPGGGGGGSGVFSASLVNAMDPQKILVSPSGTADSVSSVFDKGTLITLVQAVMTMLIMWLTMIVVIAVGIMLLIRYIYLLILLVLMPLAWLFWVTPRFTHLNKDWWDKFFQQVLYLPAVMFFIWLAMGIQKSTNAGSGIAQALSRSGFGVAIFDTVINILLIGGFLIAGLIAAQKLGAAGSGMAMGFTRGAGRRLGRWSSRGLGAATRPLSEATARTGRGAARAIGQRFTAFKGAADAARQTTAGRWFNRLTLGAAGAVTGAVGRAGARMVGAGEKGDKTRADAKKKQYLTTYVTDNARKTAYKAGGRTQEDLAGLIAMAIEKNEVDDLFRAQRHNQEALIRAAGNYGIEDDLSKARPEVAHRFASDEDKERARTTIRQNVRSNQEAKLERLREKAQDPTLPWAWQQAIAQEITSLQEAISQPLEGIVVSDETLTIHFVSEAARKGTEKNASKDFSTEALSDAAVAAGMNIGKLKAIGRTGDSGKIEAVRSGLERLRSVIDEGGGNNFSPTQLHNIKRMLEFADNNPVLVGASDFTGSQDQTTSGTQQP